MKDLTDIICIVDKSGSMGIVKNDAIGGFNNFLSEQKALPGKATMTLTLFDTVVNTLSVRKPLEDVAGLTVETYRPDGMTALLDATGKTLNEAVKAIDALPDDEKPEKVIVVIITDGEENSSREYSRGAVAALTKELQDQRKWEFLYLGANQDAFLEAGKIGIPQSSAVSFNATGQGVRMAYADVSHTVSSYRTGTSPKEPRQ